MAAPTTVKVFCGDQCRRFFVDTFQDLTEQLRALVGVHPRDVVLTYTDDDGDLVTLSTDVEFRAAVASTSKSCLIFHLQPLAATSSVHVDAQPPDFPIPSSPPLPSAPPHDAHIHTPPNATSSMSPYHEAEPALIGPDLAPHLAVAAHPGAMIDRVYRIPCPRLREKLPKIRNYGFKASGTLPPDAELRIHSALRCANQTCRKGRHAAPAERRECRGPELLCQLLVRAPHSPGAHLEGAFQFVSRKTGRAHPLSVRVEVDVWADQSRVSTPEVLGDLPQDMGVDETPPRETHEQNRRRVEYITFVVQFVVHELYDDVA